MKILIEALEWYLFHLEHDLAPQDTDATEKLNEKIQQTKDLLNFLTKYWRKSVICL